jgi:glycosyltransferase involved in cell wall biosynthesis
MRVDQVLGSSAPFDAVTTQAFAYRETLAADGGVYAAEIARSGVPGVKLLDALPADGDALLIVHYTGYVPGMRVLLEHPARKLLVYHNITPARYFWNLEPYVATICQLGRDALPEWVAAADVPAAVSRFNAGELAQAGAVDPMVIPILVDPARLEPDAGSAAVPGGRPLVLCVGRLSPHKRHDLVLRAFARFQRLHAPGATLLCVGFALDRPYLRRIERVAEEEGARGVSFVEQLPQAELNRAYREADVLLSMSEHEGFCVPLLEAFHFGVPVVARRAGGMPEVGGDAVLWLEGPDGVGEPNGVEEPDGVEVAAELLRLAATEAPLRDELARRGRARLEELSLERAREALRAAAARALGEPAPAYSRNAE